MRFFGPHTVHDVRPTWSQVEQGANHTSVLIFISRCTMFIYIQPGCSSNEIVNCFRLSISNLLSNSWMYLYWCIMVPFFVCLTWSPRKEFNYPIILISNSLPISSSNSLHMDSFVAPKIMSSSYTYTISRFLPLFNRNNVLSILPRENPFSRRNFDNLSYHAVRACFKPYNALFNLYTWFGKSWLSKLGGYCTNTFSFKYPFRKARFTSIWYSLKPLYDAKAMSMRISSILATRARNSS